jgi:hypothetical protein
MDEDLQSVLKIYRKARLGHANAVRKRTKAEKEAADARGEEGQQQLLLNQLVPLLTSMPGGSQGMSAINVEAAQGIAGDAETAPAAPAGPTVNVTGPDPLPAPATAKADKSPAKATATAKA